MPYTKLDAGLIFSTVWREPHTTRIVWVTMLAMADKHGEVMASVPGLADASRVTQPECQAALHAFLSPDPDSRTPDYQGRRIEKIPGGWVLLNHGEHRKRGDGEDRKAKAAARAQRYRNRQKASLEPVLDCFDPPPDEFNQPDRHVLRDAGVTDAHASRTVTGSHDKQLSSKQSPKAELPTTTTSAPTARRTWLSCFLDTWHEFVPDAPDQSLAPQIARHFRPLTRKHTDEEICDQLRLYLRQVGTQYASPAGFARAFGTWTGKRQHGATESKQERGRAAIARSLQRRENQNGEHESHREVSGPVPRALPHPRRDGRDD